ncbi:MAG: 23S rRNA (adenine(2503)-C(2))-methyltransferase RlmN [Christensenella sp.]|nr:23S rRNA (adenine(2503)-C(2))-methyltransferase RlmN [Christensenella sp.]
MKNLLDYDLDELKQEMARIGEKPFRATQIMEWLTKGVYIGSMANLGAPLREKLQTNYIEGFPKIADVRISRDGTKKYLFRYHDGSTVESVFMQKNYGNTICVSTQVGCRMGCRFCASGKFGLSRNLTAGEILGQVIAVNADQGSGRNITNIVLMGMGEPLDNYDNVVKFLRLINDAHSLQIGYRNISLSTCGLPEKIMRFAQEGMPVTLSISLHASTDEKRRETMPIAQKYTISEVLDAARNYFHKTGRRIIIEYAVIENQNDTEEDAAQLKEALRGLNCHVNLIALNPNDDGIFSAPNKDRVYAFCKMLEQYGLSATVRRSMGGDIDGACGQLRQRFEKSEE